MRRSQSGPVELGDLLGARDPDVLMVRHLCSTTTRVQDIALISDIEEITAVGPDTVILLADSAAMGGWMISAALRYAWERRASALVVPAESLTDTTSELARRLDVSLLAARGDFTRLALDLALHMGMARAGSVAQVQSFTERIAHAESLSAALALVSQELGDRVVRIESSGAVLIEAGGAQGGAGSGADSQGADGQRSGEARSGLRRNRDGSPANARADEPQHLSRGEEAPQEISAAVGSGSRSEELLTVHVHEYEHQLDYAAQVLAAAAPSVRALLTESRLQAMHDSLPTISMTALTGTPLEDLAGAPGEDSLTALVQWPISGAYVAVCILTQDCERLGAAVHQIWEGRFPTVPLARVEGGWLALVPVTSRKQDRDRLHTAMREQFRPARGLGLQVGVSTRYEGRDTTVRAVREAWLAARLAAGEGAESGAGDADGRARSARAGGLLVFSDASAQLLARVLPTGLAWELARVMLPGLLADPGRSEVIQAVVAYLSCRGSATGAAKVLGVHRNTLQTRIRRAEELGVPLSAPADVLPTHLLLSALERGPESAGGAGD